MSVLYGIIFSGFVVLTLVIVIQHETIVVLWTLLPLIAMDSILFAAVPDKDLILI